MLTLLFALIAHAAHAQPAAGTIPSVCGRLTTCGTFAGSSSQNWSDGEAKTFRTTLELTEPRPGVVHLTETVVGEETTVWRLELTFAPDATFTVRERGGAGAALGAGNCTPPDCFFRFAPPLAKGGATFGFTKGRALFRIDQMLPSGRAFTRLGHLDPVR